MDIRVLGPLDVRVDGDSVQLGGPKQRALLALLVAAAPRVVSTDALIEGLWGEQPSPGARSTLQTYVSNLRQVLGGGLVHDRGGYRLDVDPESVDSVRFQRILQESRSRLTTDPGVTASSLKEALNLWQGRPYADLIDVPGLEPEARRLEELRLEAVELRIDADLASGLHGALVAELDALAEQHPTREHFRAQHMLALYRSGRQAEALRAYRRTESVLAEELGVEPSRELQELELKVLQQDESLLGGSGRTVTQRLAFLVTDIEGSTRLWDRHAQDMADALATHDRMLREAIEAEGGRVFKHTGDGLLAAFPDTVAAVRAAESGLRRLADADWGDVGELKVRIGIDVGEAETRGNDFFGPPVNRATRLCAIGHGGQVLVSSSAQAELSAAAPTGLQIRHLGEIRLRGLATPESVAQLVFVGLQADFPDLRTDAESELDQRLEVLSVPGYEVRDRIGEGDFGVVWRAYQPSVGREVAIKAIRQELASQPSFVRRFEAEARTIARLAHPHIVPLIDFWRDGESAYLVLGLLQGGSLARAMAAGLVDRSTARRVLVQIGNALDHAHSQGMVHGDLKPANVLLDGASNAYLSDFGLTARLLYPEVVSSCSTDPAYRAPEETEAGPSPAGDRYGLGVLARALFDDDPNLEAVLARATAPRPDDRFESSAAFISDLDRVMGLEAEVAPPVVSRNPYKGLRAFDEGDSADFYGREELIATLLAALSEHRFVTVVGPSGSGKSSVVLAGLLPRVASGALSGSVSWARSVLTPGSDPLAALVDAIEAVSTEPVSQDDLAKTGLGPSLGGELLLVIDQFEELYTLTNSSEQRDQFIEIITTAVKDPHCAVTVVATLRADFYDRPLEDPQLGRLVRDGLVTVLAPTRDELVEMIVAPSQAVGLRWEPGLPHRIAEDIAHQPGGLPLLQYALTELVERRNGDLLTAIDYDRVDGVAGALATRAESIYRDLTSSQQEAARQVLLRLVTVDEESDDTRRRVRRSELESIGISRADLDAVLETFTSQRLLLADRDPSTRGPTVEVAHEALLREWPRLSAWVDDQREALILGRRFRGALADWVVADRNDDYLLTGSRLAPFTGWAETAALTAEEQGYYRSSRDKDDRERMSRRRRRRSLTGILAGAALVASTLGVLAVLQAQRATGEAERALAAEERAADQADRATAEAQRATDSSRLARSRELAAAAEGALETDPVLSKLLAISAIDIVGGEPALDVRSTLRRAIDRDRIEAEYIWPADREVSSLWADLHPSLPRLVSGGEWPGTSSYLELYDFDRQGVVWSFETDDPAIIIDRPMFSPDGDLVVAGIVWTPESPPSGDVLVEPLGAVLFDAGTGEIVDLIPLHSRCGGLVMDFSPTHVLVAYAADPDFDCGPIGPDHRFRVELVELGSKERQLLTPSTTDAFSYLSGDGRFVAFTDLAAENEQVTVVAEIGSGRRVLEFDPKDHHGITDGWPQDLNDDGSLLLAGDRPIAVWDVAAGRIVATFAGHDGGAIPRFAPDGETVFSMGREGTLRHWLALRGTELANYPSVGTGGSVSVQDDGSVLVVDQAARVARLIDTVIGVETCGGFVLSHSVDVEGEQAVIAEWCPDGRWLSSFVDLGSGEIVEAFDSRSQVQSISPDGNLMVVQEPGDPLPADTPGSDFEGWWVGSLWIRDLRSGERVTELQGLCSWGFNGPIDHCASYPDTPFPLWAWKLVWSPDGRLLATVNNAAMASNADYVVVWDVASGGIVADYSCSSRASGAVFSPDGSELIVSCSSGDIVALDTETWEVIRSNELDTSVEGRDSVGFIGFGADGSTLVAVSGDAGGGVGGLLWIDPGTLSVQVDRLRAFVGSPKSYAINQGRTLVAIGASDGFVKVFDIEGRSLTDELQIDGEAQGLGFPTDDTLVVAPESGNLYAYTLDVPELMRSARDSLRRGFTPLECERHGFGEDCPTLEEMQVP